MTQEIKKEIKADWNLLRGMMIDAGKEYREHETEDNYEIVMNFIKRAAREVSDTLYRDDDVMWMTVYWKAANDLNYFFKYGYEH